MTREILKGRDNWLFTFMAEVIPRVENAEAAGGAEQPETNRVVDRRCLTAGGRSCGLLSHHAHIHTCVTDCFHWMPAADLVALVTLERLWGPRGIQVPIRPSESPWLIQSRAVEWEIGLDTLIRLLGEHADGALKIVGQPSVGKVHLLDVLTLLNLICHPTEESEVNVSPYPSLYMHMVVIHGE